MPLIKAEYELCQGYANCVVGAEDVFDLDDDGVVVLSKSDVPRSRPCPRRRPPHAAVRCPRSGWRTHDPSDCRGRAVPSPEPASRAPSAGSTTTAAIRIVEAEPHLPYDKPPLSKASLEPGAIRSFRC